MAGCKGGEVTACMYICPHDLMKLDTERMKAINQEPDLCWECYFCVKICPNNAIEMRGYTDVMPMGATLKPVRDPKIYVFKARAVVCACGGATNIWRPHAVGESGVFRGSHAIGPCVDNKWLTLG